MGGGLKPQDISKKGSICHTFHNSHLQLQYLGRELPKNCRAIDFANKLVQLFQVASFY